MQCASQTETLSSSAWPRRWAAADRRASWSSTRRGPRAPLATWPWFPAATGSRRGRRRAGARPPAGRSGAAPPGPGRRWLPPLAACLMLGAAACGRARSGVRSAPPGYRPPGAGAAGRGRPDHGHVPGPLAGRQRARPGRSARPPPRRPSTAVWSVRPRPSWTPSIRVSRSTRPWPFGSDRPAATSSIWPSATTRCTRSTWSRPRCARSASTVATSSRPRTPCSSAPARRSAPAPRLAAPVAIQYLSGPRPDAGVLAIVDQTRAVVEVGARSGADPRARYRAARRGASLARSAPTSTGTCTCSTAARSSCSSTRRWTSARSIRLG